MKFMKLALSAFVLFGSLGAQTLDLGQGVFYNDEGPIVVAIDASVVILKPDSPYVMFMAYMGMGVRRSVTITRDTVTLIYQNKEYKMPSVKELRANYQNERNDTELYNRGGKESLILSQMKNWEYQPDVNFFPSLSSGIVSQNSGSMTNSLGIKTRMYFKNPGFKKGDQLLIKITDKKDPALAGSCEVILN